LLKTFFTVLQGELPGELDTLRFDEPAPSDVAAAAEEDADAPRSSCSRTDGRAGPPGALLDAAAEDDDEFLFLRDMVTR